MKNSEMVQQSNIFAVVLTKQILKVLSMVRNIYQKFDWIILSNVYMITYDHLKRFLWIDDKIISGKMVIGHIFRTDVNECFM